MQRESWLVGVYRRRIGPPRSASEAYGYWLFVAGLLLLIGGAGLLLAADYLPWSAAVFDALVVGGALFMAAGFPVALLGITVRLPLQPLATVLGGVGTTAAVASAAWIFATVGPPLTVPAVLLPGAVYLGGVGLLVVALVVVPLTTMTPGGVGGSSVPEPYYELREGADGWIWRLRDRDGTVVAEGAHAYDRPEAARAALDRVSTGAPMAGVELTVGE